MHLIHPSCLLYYINGRRFTHVSIGLEESENVFFSFNYKGFCIETTEKHHCRGVRKSLIYEIEVVDNIYTEIKQRIFVLQNHQADYRYTRFGGLCVILEIPFHWKNHYICSQFVTELLKDTGAVPFIKRLELYLPNQLCTELESYSKALKKIQNPI